MLESRRDYRQYQKLSTEMVFRMPENRLLCKALQYRPQGKRDLGRPYLCWKDQFM